jgi:hypothetical protein
MWIPPWVNRSAFGALGAPGPLYDRDFAAIEAWKRTGNEKLFRDVFNRYSRGLYLYLYYGTRIQGAEDESFLDVTGPDGRQYRLPESQTAVRLLNKVYYNALRFLKDGDYRYQAGLGTWLHAIAHNVMIDEAKFATRNPEKQKERLFREAVRIATEGSEAELEQATEQSAVEKLAEGGSTANAAGALAFFAKLTDANGNPLLSPDMLALGLLRMKFGDDYSAIGAAHTRGGRKMPISPEAARDLVAVFERKLEQLKNSPEGKAAYRKLIEEGQL